MSSTKNLLLQNKLEYIDRNLLHYLLKTPRLSDVEFIVKEQKFPANRCVMSAASEVFEAMLFGPFQEASKQEIVITDVTHPGSFSSLLLYIYGFGIQVDSLCIEEVLEVLKLGHRYRLPQLCTALQNYVSNLDLETTSDYCFGSAAFMELLNNAFVYKIDDLYEKMKIIIKSTPKNVDTFLKHPKLTSIKCPILIELFEADKFCTEEVDILGAVLKWIDANVSMNDSNSATGKDSIKHADIESENGHVDEYCAVKNSDSGIELSSFYNRLLLNADTDTNDSGESNIKTVKEIIKNDNVDTTLDENNDDEEFEDISSKTPSDIERLLKTIRSIRLNLPDISMFLKNNSYLCKKYEEYLSPIICSSAHFNGKNRKSYVGLKMLTECTIDNFNKSCATLKYLDSTISIVVKCDSNGAFVKLNVEDLNCDCSKEQRATFSLKYTLQIKSCNPFKDKMVIEKKKCVQYTPGVKEAPPTHCPHGSVYKLQNYSHVYTSNCGYNCRRDSKICPHGYQLSNAYSCGYGCRQGKATQTTITLVDSQLPSKQNLTGFIKNSSFTLEAFLEVVE